MLAFHNICIILTILLCLSLPLLFPFLLRFGRHDFCLRCLPTGDLYIEQAPPPETYWCAPFSEQPAKKSLALAVSYIPSLRGSLLWL